MAFNHGFSLDRSIFSCALAGNYLLSPVACLSGDNSSTLEDSDLIIFDRSCRWRRSVKVQSHTRKTMRKKLLISC